MTQSSIWHAYIWLLWMIRVCMHLGVKRFRHSYISEEVIKLKPHWLVWLCTVNLALDWRCLRKLTIIDGNLNLAVICPR